ncbi:MAG: FRG domain-containing protein [Fimbriimonadaceae bacterium]
MAYIVDQKIESIAELLPILLNHCPPDKIRWFRGQRDSGWNLTPRLSRGAVEEEEIITARFNQNAYQYVSEAQRTEWETLYLMQHYGAPTRLLDWSENPLAALYFAVESSVPPDENETDGLLWLLDPVKLNTNANIKSDNPRYLPLPNDEVMNNYKPSVLRSEAKTNFFPIAFVAPRNSNRMVAQLGAFTVCHREFMDLDAIGDKAHVGRISVSKDKKESIRAELSALRINRLTLFPELVSVAAYAGGD